MEAKNKIHSEDSTESRYQKALKEINKLINFNNELKNELKNRDV